MLVNLPDNSAPVTVDWMAYLAAEKTRVQTELAASRQRLDAQVQFFVKPAPNQGGNMGVASWVNRGMAIYKGVATGLMVMRAVRGLFGKKR